MSTLAISNSPVATGRSTCRVRWASLCLWALCLWAPNLWPAHCAAEPRIGVGSGLRSNANRAGDGEAQMKVSLGLAGVWKIGHVTPLRVELPRRWFERPQTIEVQTFDGDGVAVTYKHSIQRITPGANPGAAPQDPAKRSDYLTHWCWISVGRVDRPVTVRVLDGKGAEIQSQVLSGEQLGKALPTLQPWIVAIGNSLGIEATSVTQTDTGLANFTTTVLTSADELPDQWRGLAACDLLILPTTPTSITESAPLVDALTARQWLAINDWCHHGGTIVMSLGKYATEMSGDSPMAALLPGPVIEQLTNIDSGTLESATATKIRLGPITAVRLGDVHGKVELAMVDNGARRFPWWVRTARGKGVIHVLASDLDQPALKNWADRRLIWDKVLSSFWSRELRNDSASVDRNTSGSTFLGYDDLVGQLRSTLDYFPAARVFSFGAITAILAGILVLIGPVDYWFSVRLLRKPSFSWIFSGAVILLSSAGLIWLHTISRPNQLLLNSTQVVDFLPTQKRMLVDSWTHVYSSRARTIDASLQFKHAAESVRLDWQGLPGKGLGGMESNLLTDQNMPGYTIEVARDETPSDEPNSSPDNSPNAAPNESSSMLGVGIPASGTKCLFATWSGQFEPQGQSLLVELKGIDQIQGRLVNPLPYEIRKPVLFYHNWAYNLPSRLRPGEEIAITYEMVPKDLMRRLNKRQVVDSKDVLANWSPDDRESLDRLMEIMMFYKASGGADYTKLKHRFQPRMDVSNVLALDQAVLVGQLSEPMGHVTFADKPSENVEQETSSTWCRVLLPVARAEE